MAKEKKKTEQVMGFREKIEDLLSNYVDGRDVFKKADDWDYKLELVPGAEDKDIPRNWIELADKVISILAHDKYGLDTYKNRIEIISAETMLDLYASVGLPESYPHWSFGMQREQEGKSYNQGRSGLAYEIVINTDPAIAYCMDSNTKTMQMLVIAHASYGHNSFFKGNHMFKQFTKPRNILADQAAMCEAVLRYEDKYGQEEVEKVLDAAHALQNYGVNRYNKPKTRTPQEEAARRAELEEMRQRNVNPLMDSPVFRDAFNNVANDNGEKQLFPADLEENLLRYVAAYAPHLQEWQRDLVRRVSDLSQYFYPQRQTQVMNEGWASFWHYTIMNDLHEMDLIDDGMSMEFVQSHCGVLFQPEFDSPYYSGWNPYALGFAIYQDIKRMCENPTDEDREYFPDIAGKEWLPTLKWAMQNFKDESFIEQFLSPKVIRDMGMFNIHDDELEEFLVVDAVQNRDGYKVIAERLAAQYRLAEREPAIEVAGYNYRGDRSLTLQHKIFKYRPLHEENTKGVLKHLYSLWGHPVVLHSVDPESGTVGATISVPTNAAERGLKIGDKMKYNI